MNSRMLDRFLRRLLREGKLNSRQKIAVEMMRKDPDARITLIKRIKRMPTYSADGDFLKWLWENRYEIMKFIMEIVEMFKSVSFVKKLGIALFILAITATGANAGEWVKRCGPFGCELVWVDTPAQAPALAPAQAPALAPAVNCKCDPCLCAAPMQTAEPPLFKRMPYTPEQQRVGFLRRIFSRFRYAR